MKPTHSLSFFRLVLVQAQVMFADNGGKLTLIALLQFPGIISGSREITLIAVLASLLVLPFLVLSPVAGWTADRFGKVQILRFTLAAQLLALAVILAGLLLRSLPLAVVGFGLLATQSAFFSPARQGVLKELVPERRIAAAAGVMALFAIASIFAGTWFGGRFFDLSIAWVDDPWRAAAFAFIVLTLLASVALAAWWQQPAGGNLMVHGAGLIAVFAYWGLARWLGLGASAQFWAMLVPTLVMFIYALRNYAGETLRLIVSPLARLWLRTRAVGLDNIPSEGGVVFLATHGSYADAVALQAVLPRKLRFLGASKLIRFRILRWCFELFGVLPVSPEQPRTAIREAVRALQAGEWVCLFPEGSLSTSGTLGELKKGFEVIAAKAGVPVVPVAIDGLWGTIYSAGTAWRAALHTVGARRARLRFGRALSGEDARAERVRASLLELGEANFAEREGLEGNLGAVAVASLKRRPWRVAVEEQVPETRRVRSALLLGLAFALASRVRSDAAEDCRVAIALPPGIGAVVANLACILAGKIPVNLNFTAGAEPLAASVKQAETRLLLTHPKVREKCTGLPEFSAEADVAALLAEIGKLRILAWAVLACLLPTRWICRLAAGRRLPRGREEAALLFTSGSSGMPKGVPLTHRNLLANVYQCASTSLLRRNDRVLACLPFFHSFGFTVTFWLPLIRGQCLVTAPVATDGRGVVKAIREGEATIVAGTALFLRLYADRAADADFKSVRVAIAGAEALPEAVAETYHTRFGVPVLEGYGLTEAAPAIALNFVEPKEGLGTVGPLLPGLDVRLIEAETGEAAAPGSSGVLQIKGANIFEGYLHEEDSDKRENLKAGWLKTGDLVAFDPSGRLKIEGRLSRFSKIAGEMVPHGTVERAIAEGLQFKAEEGPGCVVVGEPDEQRGERLVLLSIQNIAIDSLRKIWKQRGLPALWMPREVLHVEQIPVLGSGKLDLATCKKLAASR